MKYKTIFEIFRDIFQLYAFILAVLVLLNQLGIFSIELEPLSVKVLNPIYSFKKYHLKKASQILADAGVQTKIDTSFNGDIATWNLPASSYTDDSSHAYHKKYELPFKHIYLGDIQDYTTGSGLDRGSLLKKWGIIDFGHETLGFNSDANRNDDQKYIGVSGLIDRDIWFDADNTGLKYYHYQTWMNPSNSLLREFKFKIRGQQTDYYNSLYNATNVYSIISVQNFSDQEMKNLNIYLNDVVDYIGYTLVGWVPSWSDVRVISDHANIKLLIDRLAAGKSIEFVISANQILRQNDLNVEVSKMYSYDREKIILWMSGAFVGVIILYILQLKKNLKKE